MHNTEYPSLYSTAGKVKLTWFPDPPAWSFVSTTSVKSKAPAFLSPRPCNTFTSSHGLPLHVSSVAPFETSLIRTSGVILFIKANTSVMGLSVVTGDNEQYTDTKVTVTAELKHASRQQLFLQDITCTQSSMLTRHRTHEEVWYLKIQSQPNYLTYLVFCSRSRRSSVHKVFVVS